MKVDDTGHRPFALPGSSLRYGPDKLVDVLHIDLHLVPDLERARLEGVCTMTVRALDEPVPMLALDAVDLVVSHARSGSQSLEAVRRGKKLEVRFDPPIEPEEERTFSVAYSVERPRHGLFFIQPSSEYPNLVRHAWTQSQDENARYWFPCLDYPHDKQTTSATIVVPKGQFALANGALVERRDDAGTTTFTYRQDVPHSTYLTTMVVGPFVEIEQRSVSGPGGKVTPVFYYVLPGREADGERAFGNTPRMVEVFQDRLGAAYPYARYSQIAVSEFIFGGMENTSATTQTDRTLHDERAHLDFSSDPLVSHELAHQWFGDLITCRDWAHAWLNEGFATFFETVFREADLGEDEYLYDVFGCLERYLEEDADRYRRPIVYNRFRDPIELFDRHLYEKGAAVLHMLRGELGEARFWRTMRRYVADNAGRNVETIDFIRAIEDATGRNMRGFFDQWVFRGGHPKLSVAVSYDERRSVATIAIDQKQSVDEHNPAFEFDVDVAFDERTIRVRVERAHETIAVPLDSRPSLVRFDPGAHILADVTYEFGVDFAAAALANDPSVVARIRAARELAKDGSAPAREALANAVENETFWGVLEQTAHALGKTRAAWARDILVRAMSHSNPKVRRAAASALGEFKDAEAAAALLGPASDDASYFVQAAALHSLGKTRDRRAFEILAAAVRARSWNGTVESGAARGLGELADSRATSLLVEACKAGNEEALRRAALGAIAQQGELVHSERPAALDAIAAALDDSNFIVQRGAIHAAERLADARFLPDLDRLSAAAFDGRIRRDSTEAGMRIRESAKVPAQVTGLRTDLDALREEQRKLQDKIETIARS
ncbi:MAG TPA: M1 family metallopeptidase [Candidatus Baltobacteraceae bacterium]|jgi:aminopeptidase N|nr:M1 family metallopeptidase [Candidatus Baltobacteraceae bacterium]